MSENLLIIFTILALVSIILFGIFAFNAIDNLGDSFDTTYHHKSYLFKGIGYFIYSSICGFAFIKIFDLLILNL